MEAFNGLEAAVIGMSGRFPGAGNIGEFWRNLKNGVESISFFSEDELRQEGEEEGVIHDPMYVRANAFLQDKEYFDACFFGYRPEEAALMDPQTRIFHECVWEAIEDAGCDLDDPKNKIGLYAGATPNLNWEAYVQLVNREKLVDGISAYRLSNIRFMATAIAYAFNLRGPALMVDTACSTSLIAVHQAYRSLLLADCNIAIAGGVSIANRSKRGYLYEDGMIFSRDGHCRTFDQAASGTVNGEGAGVIVLKLLKNALKDRDHIWAIIKGSGVNNDGNKKVGYTAPSVDGQAEAILMAQRWAKIAPESIGYIEAHGTATRLGDPIEVKALSRVFGSANGKYCALGSVKSNIGHLDAAAGIAGLIKAVLTLKYGQISPTLHFRTINPEIELSSGPFYVNDTLRDWQRGKYPRRAGVSSFGIGGTNAHVVLEEPPPATADVSRRDRHLLVISAKTQTALAGNIRNLKDYLETNRQTDLADIAYTLQVGRAHFPYRAAFVCKDSVDAVEQLFNWSPGDASEAILSKARLVFMFSGQGSQYEGMCKDLYEREEVFKEEVDNCLAIAEKYCNKGLKGILFPPEAGGGLHRVDQTQYAQPLLFIIEYALARLLMKWGIAPDRMIGHSIGEYVAACLSGVFSLEDALYLVIKRGELMQGAPTGIMLGVSISETDLHPLLGKNKDISLATVNSSELCVVAGEEPEIRGFASILEEKGYKSSVLHTSHAFHSWMMDGILDAFRQEVQKVKIHPPQVPFFSNVSGKLASFDDLSRPDYWVDHLRRTVRFSEGIVSAFTFGQTVFIEVGPGRTLSTFVRANQLREKGHSVVSTVRHGKEPGNDQHYLLSAIGRLWSLGVTPAWDRFYEKEQRRKASLPAYAFDRIAFPALVNAYELLRSGSAADGRGREADRANWFYAPVWKLSAAEPPAGRKGTCTLLFADDAGVSDELAGFYRAAGETLVCIKAGSGIEEVSPLTYRIDPVNKAAYAELFDRLVSKGMYPGRIVHCWGVSARSASPAPPEEPFSDVSCARCFTSVLHSIKALKREGQAMPTEMVVVTSSLHPVTADPEAPSVKSLSIPFLKVLAQEHPSILTCHIDIGLPGERDASSIGDLYKELAGIRPGAVISLRHGRRWEQVFDPVRPRDGEQERILKDGGVYLITGGLGKIGLFLAGELIRLHQARVILVGRTVSPGANGPAQERLAQLEQEGQLLYVHADVSVKAELEEAIKMAEERFGPLSGVFHAAGVVGGDSINMVEELREEDLAVQFQPKIKGLLALEQVLADKALDFCLLFSSLSAVLGGIRFGAYGPANIFMDYHVRARRKKGGLINWMSVNFDGIGVSNTARDGIRWKELMPVLEDLLAMRRLPQVVVSTSGLRQRLDNWVYRDDRESEGSAVAVNDECSSTTDRLVALWRSFFGKEDIGPASDFFETGGDSLKALTMAGRIYKTLNVEITIKDLYACPTIKKLSQYIDSLARPGKDSGFTPIPKAISRDHYPCSSAQKRLFFLQELDKRSILYNIPWVLRLRGKIDKERLKFVLNELVNRHESLRTSFTTVNDLPVQVIEPRADVQMKCIEAVEGAEESFLQEPILPFDLSVPPLIRAKLIEGPGDDAIILVDIHHIATDGVSYGVLAKEFMMLYNGETPEQPKLQYKDYSEWQQSEAQVRRVASQKAFWKNELSDFEVSVDLPIDFARPLKRPEEGSIAPFTLDERRAAGFRQLAAQCGVSTFAVLLSLFNILLRKLTGGEDIIIGTNTAGRQHPDLEKVVGIFVNTVPLRNYPAGERFFRDFVRDVHSRALAAFKNQDYQFETLIDDLGIIRDQSRHPLFDAFILYQNFDLPEFSITGLTLLGSEIRTKRAKFDLCLTAREHNGRLLLEFEYSPALFRKATMERCISLFLVLVDKAITDPGTTIADL